MSEWNRLNYDELEAETRWSAPVMPGVPRLLALYLGLSAILLLPWSPMF